MTSAGHPTDPQGPGDDAAVFNWALIGSIVLFVLRAPLRHKGLAAACFFLAVGAAVAALAVFPFKYRSDAVVLARPNPLTGALSTGVNRELDTPTRFAREALLKRENLKELAKATHLVERYMAERPYAVRAKQKLLKALAGREPTPEQRLEGLVDTLEDRLIVNVDKETVTLSFQWWSPQIAFEVVQGALQNFLETRHASEIKTIGEAISILESHRAQLEGEINARIAKLEKQRDQDRGASRVARATAIVAGGSDRDLARLESTLAARRQAASDLESFRRQRLAQVQAELAQQQSMYAPDHPAIASTKRVLATLSQPSQQAEELASEIDELEQQVQRRRSSSGGGAAAAGSVATQVEEARERYGNQDPRTEFELRQLELLLDQHWNLMGRINQSRLEMETAQAAFDQRYSVIAPPQVPGRPVQPYGLLFTVGGLFGGIALALFATTVADLRRGVVLERWQVEQQLELPVISEVRHL